MRNSFLLFSFSSLLISTVSGFSQKIPKAELTKDINYLFSQNMNNNQTFHIDSFGTVKYEFQKKDYNFNIVDIVSFKIIPEFHSSTQLLKGGILFECRSSDCIYSLTDNSRTKSIEIYINSEAIATKITTKLLLLKDVNR